MSSKAVSQTRKSRASTTEDLEPENAPVFMTPLPEKLAALLSEARWLILTAAAFFMALALWGYDRRDPSWSSASHSDEIHNPVGTVGAWLSDLLFWLFGFSAWWWVFLPLFVGLLGFRRFAAAETISDRRHIIVKAIGFVVLLTSSCSLEHLRFYSYRGDLPYKEAGGMLGEQFGTFLSSHIGITGATLALIALFAVGWSLFSGMSWIGTAEAIGNALEKSWLFLRRAVEGWHDRRLGRETAREREIGVALEKKRAEEHEPIRIEIAETAPNKPSPKLEKRIRREKQPALFPEARVGGRLPTLNLLAPAAAASDLPNAETLEYTSRLIERKLADFGVEVRVISAHPGPVVTRYEVEPAVGVKGSQVVNLARDLARALALVSIRVVETVPGKSYMALELPNPRRQIVRLSEIISSKVYNETTAPLTVTLGKDISGHPVVVDLAKMPHLLVAGTTGSGKSVGINAMILSLLYKTEPESVRLILVDPKMLELSIYEGIPHLLTPVVTDMRKAANALKWCVGEMDRRYKIMSKLGVRNLASANARILEAKKNGEQIDNPISLTPDAPEPLKQMPYIVVIIDELADLMMVVGKKVEELIARLAQKARASGIHLVLATQRPSVDVITGLIKANIPTRIAFQVSSRIDSRTILDQMGAETLLGQGDMLYLPPGSGYPQRVHGAFVADEEVHRVVDFLKSLGEPEYVEGLTGGGGGNGDDGDFEGGDADSDSEADELYDQAVEIVLKSRRASISLVQRHLRIGYNRAARLIEAMENAGLVSEMDSRGGREVLAPRHEED